MVVFIIVEVFPIWLSLKPEYLQALVASEASSSSESQREECPSLCNNLTESVSECACLPDTYYDMMPRVVCLFLLSLGLACMP